jgi:hypothetical protein
MFRLGNDGTYCNSIIETAGRGVRSHDVLAGLFSVGRILIRLWMEMSDIVFGGGMQACAIVTASTWLISVLLNTLRLCFGCLAKSWGGGMAPVPLLLSYGHAMRRDVIVK